MVRCEDFYRKWEEVPNWCEKCDETSRRINLYVDLVKEHPPIGGISEGATRPLLRIKDPVIRERAISHIEKFMSHNGRNGKLPKCTAKDVESIVADAEIELRNEKTYGSNEEEASPVNVSTQDGVDAILVRDSPVEVSEQEILDEDVRLRAIPEPSALVVSTVTIDEIDTYFEMMMRIRCEEDLPKHQMRIDKMIENGTLRIVTVEPEGE